MLELVSAMYEVMVESAKGKDVRAEQSRLRHAPKRQVAGSNVTRVWVSIAVSMSMMDRARTENEAMRYDGGESRSRSGAEPSSQ